jgi:hypothetical protein
MQHRQGSGILLAMTKPDPEKQVEHDDFEADSPVHDTASAERPKEIGGRGGLDPTRYGDWEKAGRCIDF